MRFSLVCGKSSQNRTARWVITERAVSVVWQLLLDGHPARRERLRIESGFHIRFDLHDLAPFLISDTNAYFLWPAFTFVLIFMILLLFWFLTPMLTFCGPLSHSF
jgi:hypothetical protein